MAQSHIQKYLEKHGEVSMKEIYDNVKRSSSSIRESLRRMKNGGDIAYRTIITDDGRKFSSKMVRLVRLRE